MLILNNPNEGDKFAYWGEGEGVRAMPSARALAVPVGPIFVVSPADAASIAIAVGNDRDCPKLFERGEATEQAAPANREVIARPHNGDV